MSYQYESAFWGKAIKGDKCTSIKEARKSFANALHIEVFGWGFPMHKDDCLHNYRNEEGFLACCMKGYTGTDFRPSAQELWYDLNTTVATMHLVNFEP